MNAVRQGQTSLFARLTILTLFGLFAGVVVHNGVPMTIPYGATACGFMWIGTYLSFFTYPPGRLGCATDVAVIIRGILSYSLVGVGIYMVLQWNEMLGAG